MLSLPTTSRSTKRRIVASVGLVLGALTLDTLSTDTASASTPPAMSYSMLSSSGQIVGLGGAYSAPAPTPQNGWSTPSAPVAVADTADGQGALVASTNGDVTALGDAVAAGSVAQYHVASPVIDIVTDAANGGYWMLTGNGGVFAFGGAPFFGSEGGQAVAAPIVGMAATPDDGGYWLVTSNGVVYAFGDAQSYGSLAGMHLGSPIVAMASSTDGKGYWFVAALGGVFAFGDAAFDGSAAPLGLTQPIIGMAPTPDGGGYWLANAQGGVFSYGDAPFMGSAAPMKVHFVSFSTGPVVSPVVPVVKADAYADPFRAVKLSPSRIDEGVDYGGDGPVYALGDGIVESTTGAWPGGGYITYKLTNGPAAGHLVYLAENVTPTVSVGQSVTPNTVIGIMHNAYPYIETGWSYDQEGDTMAAASGAWTSTADSASLPSAYGINFNQLLVSLGAPSGEQVSSTVIGTLQPGWPTW